LRRRSAGNRKVKIPGLIGLALLAYIFPGGFQTLRAQPDSRWAIVIAGVSGDPELQKAYLEEVRELRSALEDTLKFRREQVFVLFDDPSLDAALIQHKSTRENLELVCRTLKSRVRSEDLVFVFIEGHGDYNNKEFKLNLVGPDPTGEELAEMLYSIPAQRFVVANMTNCSGGSLAALSQKGKVVLTATKSGMEKNLTHTGRFLVEGLKAGNADRDKDGRVSILEAFNYASQKVGEYYTERENLQTEHPVLDDRGDGVGQGQPSAENGQGLLAKTTYMDVGAPALTEGKLGPEKQALAREVQDLERQIEALKYAKADMQEAEYEKQLEELLLKLARTNAELRKK
jgi:hypothetical protein